MNYEISGLRCRLEKNQKFIGVIGPRTKKTTSQNLQNAYNFGKWCAEHGYVVVSGLADGVDGYAHQGALDAGGKTIAVVSTTKKQDIFPGHHMELAEKIKENGCIVHPFTVDHAYPVLKLSGNSRRLVERNFLIAYLCPSIVVVQRENKLITGGTRWAMNAGIWFGKRVCRLGDGGVQELDENPPFQKDSVWWEMELVLPIDGDQKIQRKQP